MYQYIVKPTFDILTSLVLLVLSSPILFVASVLIFVITRENPFFVQLRPGRNEKIFPLYKLRSMTNKRDHHGQLLPDEDRLTAIGKIIRKLSIDELPQLFNVIKGDMSIIGPRPQLTEYLPLYNDFQRKRHLVKPGITGWAQVHGRNRQTWEQRFQLDVWYVKNLTFKTDLKIIALTVNKVLRRKDIDHVEGGQMPKFKGT